MRALVQRVREASVSIGGEKIARIGKGLVIFVGVACSDTEEEALGLAGKLAGMRIFEDEHGKMNLAAGETGAEMLVVSQFTLYADTRKGRRPSFIAAAPPETAEPLVRKVSDRLRELGFVVAEGKFQATMLVEILNDGPVTLMVELESREAGR